MNLPENSRLYIDRATIQHRIQALADEINAAHEGRSVLLLTVLNGGMIFAAELAQRLQLDLTMDCVQVSRYGHGTEGGNLRWIHRPTEPIEDRHVLLCDDIHDQGFTLQAIDRWCRESGARSVHSVVLVQKNHAREYADHTPDYCGLQIEDRFIFGMGMDYRSQYRHLPEIYEII